MSATFTAGYSFGSTELVTNTKLGLLVSSASVTGIVNAEIASDAAIADTKFAQIATADKVSGSALSDIVFFNDALVSFNDTVVYN